MFFHRFFANNWFFRRFFPKEGAEIDLEKALFFRVPVEARTLKVPHEDRIFKVPPRGN